MIRCDRKDETWIVTIDRPKKAGALTRAMLVEMADCVEAAHEAKLFLLTGTGKVFSAGADIEAARAGLATDPVWERLSGAIAALPGLTIAALNGTVAGGAFGMVLACDLRIAVPEAKFFYPVMKLGFLPQPSDPARMASVIGPARAKQLLMAGQKIDAEQAEMWGLVNQVADPADLMTCAMALGADALTAKRSHIAGIKALTA